MKNTLKFTKYVLIFAFFLGSLNAFCQNKKAKNSQFGLFISQEVTMVSVNSPNQFNLFQVPLYGASLGLKYERPLTESFLFETGFLYGYRSYRIDNFIPGIFDPLSSIVTFSSLLDDFYLHRLSVPLHLKYKMTSKWMFIVGVDLDLYLKKDRKRTIFQTDTTTPFPDDLLTADRGIQTFPIGATFGFGRKFFGKKLNTEASLLFNYNFNEFEIPVDEKSNRQVNIGVGFVMWL